MNYEELSTRYQITIGKILVKYNLEWADIYATSESTTKARQEIVLLLVKDRILKTSEIAKLLMTSPDQVGKIYNETIKSNADKPTKIKIKRNPNKPKIEKAMSQNNPPEENIKEEPKIIEEQPKIEPASKALDVLDGKIIHDQEKSTILPNELFLEQLVAQKNKAKKHLEAIECLLEFYK